MLVTGSPTVSDDLGPQRHADSTKARDQSPTARRFFGGTSIQQLLNRRSPSPLGRATVATTPTAASPSSSPRSPATSPGVAAVTPQAVCATAVGPLGWAQKTPAQVDEPRQPVVDLPATTDTAPMGLGDQQQQQQTLEVVPENAAAAADLPLPQLLQSPVVLMSAAGHEASLTQHLAGKRKVGMRPTFRVFQAETVVYIHLAAMSRTSDQNGTDRHVKMCHLAALCCPARVQSGSSLWQSYTSCVLLAFVGFALLALQCIAWAQAVLPQDTILTYTTSLPAATATCALVRCACNVTAAPLLLLHCL